MRLLGISPPTSDCPRRSRSVRLQHRRDPDEQRVTRYSCGAWLCPVCSVRLRLVRGLHYAQMLLQIDKTCCLWQREVPAGKEAWSAYKRKLNRRGACWVRFGAIDAQGIVLGSDVMPEEERPFRDVDAVVSRLGEALRMMPLETANERIRPINSCDKWKPNDDKSDYVRMEWLAVSDHRALAARLESIGVKCWVHQRSDQDRVLRRTGREYLWDVSYHVDDERRDAIEGVIGEFRGNDVSFCQT